MKEVYAGRREALRRDMRRRRLDALLVSRDVNRFYLSGFELHDAQYNESSGRLVITGDGKDWLATDSRYAEAAARLWDPDRVFVYKNDVRDIALLLRRCGCRIGIEARGVSLAFARALGGEGGLFLEAADGLAERLRHIKGPEEIAALSASFALNHKMLGWLEDSISEGRLSPGRHETDLAWTIECFFRENGATELAFPVIAATGKNAALPHATPGDDRLEAEAPLLIDAGCRLKNYCSDQTRTFWLGEKSGPAHFRFDRVYGLVREAQRAALAVMRPGVTGREAYLAARGVLEKAGEAQAFTHGLGHGVGLETHEAPSLNVHNEHPLEAGMVVTVEPGLYYPDWGGVRLEYTVLVEEGGVRIL
ncbi:MAG: aminopeptidase P family protein [Desulfovibrio sp.]|jgi:Xaa-Pro aminopeptidase|nr:aminopeptidase P family protein [Desulfovibrio sp.]